MRLMEVIKSAGAIPEENTATSSRGEDGGE
jgi:hypothetical protein